MLCASNGYRWYILPTAQAELDAQRTESRRLEEELASTEAKLTACEAQRVATAKVMGEGGVQRIRKQCCDIVRPCYGRVSTNGRAYSPVWHAQLPW